MKKKNGYSLIESIFYTVCFFIVGLLISYSIGILQETRKNAKNTSIINTVQQMQTELEIYSLSKKGYGDSRYQTSDSTGDGGHPCEVYLLPYMNLIKEKGGNVWCSTSVDNYKILTSLNDKENFYCLDSYGFGGYVNSRVGYVCGNK